MMKTLLDKFVGFFVVLFGFNEESRNQAPAIFFTDGPISGESVSRIVEVGHKKLRYRSRRNPEKILTAKITSRHNTSFEVRRGRMHFRVNGHERLLV